MAVWWCVYAGPSINGNWWKILHDSVRKSMILNRTSILLESAACDTGTLQHSPGICHAFWSASIQWNSYDKRIVSSQMDDYGDGCNHLQRDVTDLMAQEVRRTLPNPGCCLGRQFPLMIRFISKMALLFITAKTACLVDLARFNEKSVDGGKHFFEFSGKASMSRSPSERWYWNDGSKVFFLKKRQPHGWMYRCIPDDRLRLVRYRESK